MTGLDEKYQFDEGSQENSFGFERQSRSQNKSRPTKNSKEENIYQNTLQIRNNENRRCRDGSLENLNPGSMNKPPLLPKRMHGASHNENERYPQVERKEREISESYHPQMRPPLPQPRPSLKEHNDEHLSTGNMRGRDRRAKQEMAERKVRNWMGDRQSSTQSFDKEVTRPQNQNKPHHSQNQNMDWNRAEMDQSHRSRSVDRVNGRNRQEEHRSKSQGHEIQNRGHQSVSGDRFSEDFREHNKSRLNNQHSQNNLNQYIHSRDQNQDNERYHLRQNHDSNAKANSQDSKVQFIQRRKPEELRPELYK